MFNIFEVFLLNLMSTKRICTTFLKLEISRKSATTKPTKRKFEKKKYILRTTASMQLEKAQT